MDPVVANARVVLIEDDADAAAYVRAVLERRGGMVLHHHADPREALVAIASGGVDLVITDLRLPHMSGLELVVRVRALDPHLPIAVLTAHASVDHAVAAMRSRADDFLCKPVPAAELLARVAALLSSGKGARHHGDHRDVVLAIGAHPDDVELGAGGTLAAHRAAGDTVVVLTMSRGARGGASAQREREALAAAEVIGARLFLADLEDTAIEPTGEAVRTIEAVVADVSPTIVYAHSYHDRHQDHRAVHLAAASATRSVPTFACFQSPSSTVDFRPSRFSTIDGYLDRKLAMLACYVSQARRDYLDADAVRSAARYWSRFGRGELCEPLEIVRDSAVISPRRRDVGSRAATDPSDPRPLDRREGGLP